MKVVPYIELQGRTLLRPAYAKGELSALASKLSDKFEKAYVADLEGLNKNKPQLDIVQEFCDEVPTLYEGGMRYGSNVIDLLITGAERAVVGTATLVSLEDLRGAFKFSENITFKVDFRDGIVSFDPQIAGRAFLPLATDVRAIGIDDIIVPKELASEAVEAKKELGFSLGVFAPASDRARYEPLGVDYIVSEDYGRLVGND
jgi:phosphoribosylformimino-5-aminoimidazole carboxamide ribonucleotide (ProFAR) isomerase